MGATADMMVHPFGALIIGMAAGTVSTLGYRYLQVSPHMPQLIPTSHDNVLHIFLNIQSKAQATSPAKSSVATIHVVTL